MNEQTKNIFILVFSNLFLGIIIVILTGFCINFNNKLSMVTDDKTKLTESNRISTELVDSLKQKLTDRDARIEGDKRTIDTLQSNLRKSEVNNRKSEENKRRLDEANRRLEEYKRREQDRKSERNRIVAEIEKGIRKLRKDIEKIPTEAID